MLQIGDKVYIVRDYYDEENEGKEGVVYDRILGPDGVMAFRVKVGGDVLLNWHDDGCLARIED